MKIFLDTADVEAIAQWQPTGLLDGITTNPTTLSAVTDPIETIVQICKLLPDGDISVEVTEHQPDDIYKQAKKIAAIAPNVIVKIPCYAAYYSVIRQLVLEGIAINITLVFTLMQGICMSKLGVRYISPFIGRWDDLDVDGSELLYQLRDAIDYYGYSTQILAASLRTVRHVHEAIMANVDVITVPVKILEKISTHPLTDAGMKQFNADWQKRAHSRFP
ncbi:MAG TPA: transaldolase family protein [Candidatus Babeliales bacterium]|jgi:transaldolase|nr:transaldolase family protein [Candidatus Babeliales bacterium]